MIANNHRPPIPQPDLLILLDNGEPVFARELATGPAQTPATPTSRTPDASAAATREHPNPQLAYFRIIQPKTGDRVLQPLPPPGPRKGLVLAIGAYHTDQIQRIKHAIEAHLKDPDFTIYDLHPRNTQPPHRRRPAGAGSRQRQPWGGAGVGMNPNQHAQPQTLRSTVAETRKDVPWLKRAIGALLNHLTCDQPGRAEGNHQPSRQPHPGADRRGRTVEAAGGNTEQDMNDAAFQHASDHGPPAPLETYRRAYATVGLPWPGDEHARQLHPINDQTPPTRPSVQQLSWQGTENQSRPPPSRTDTHQPAPDRRGRDERPAAQRLADALGWDHIPQLSEAEQKECDLDLQTALVQARRLYQQETGEYERGWDAALELAIEVVADASDGDQAQQWLQRILHTHAGPGNEPPHQPHPAPPRSPTSWSSPERSTPMRSWRSSPPSIGGVDETVEPRSAGGRRRR